MLLPKFIAYDSNEGVRRRELDEALIAHAKEAETQSPQRNI
jgi:hypothetical protein